MCMSEGKGERDTVRQLLLRHDSKCCAKILPLGKVVVGKGEGVGDDCYC